MTNNFIIFSILFICIVILNCANYILCKNYHKTVEEKLEKANKRIKELKNELKKKQEAGIRFKI